MNRTKEYRFDSMSVGDSIVVRDRFQHARVAASEFARKHGWCFTCRMQEDRSMIVYRVEASQVWVDQRGRTGKRRIPATSSDPTAMQFEQWLSAFSIGQSYLMPSAYSHLFSAMLAWCELHSIKAHRTITTMMQEGGLMIRRIA